MRREHAPFYYCDLPFPTTMWRVKVLAAADGDTLTLTLDAGWMETKTRDLRLASIDTYERYKGTEEEKALGMAAWKMADAAVGCYGYVHTRMDPEKYGRILGDLQYVKPDGRMVWLHEELRAAGYEKPKEQG